MMRSLFSGVSGLKGHQTRMDVIGNNIANVNTTGFKSSRTTFADTFSQTTSGASSPTGNLGGTNPKQIGLGANVSSIDLIFTDGSVQSTGKNTDLCLSGNGLFVVNQGNQTFYTRNGAFEFDAEGNYVMPGSGLKVQGWMGVDGVVSTSAATTDIVVQMGKSMGAKATDQVAFNYNLDASSPIIDSITYTPIGATTATTVSTAGTYIEANTSQPVTLMLSDGSGPITLTSGRYVVGRSMPQTVGFTTYDSLGNEHAVHVLMEKTQVGTVTPPPGSPSVTNPCTGWVVSGGTIVIDEPDGSTTTLVVDPTTLTFDANGKLVTGTFACAGETLAQATGTTYSTTLGIPSAIGTASSTSGTLTETHTSPNGSLTDTIALDFSTLTQYAGMNTVSASPNGNAAGTLASIAIDGQGVITGSYTNGVRQAEAQIAVAQFNNASGLTKTGNSLYQESNNSGTANVKTAADLGVTITGSALEMSNVDIANEFSDMIITQRGFQSNSKIITVSDELLETVINMKR